MSRPEGTGRILDDSLREVRNATDFVALVSETVHLKRVGARWTGLCPFHGERTPSFSVNPEEHLWFCFGCGRGGDYIDFVRQIDNVDFLDAVAKLAMRADITLRYDDPTGELSAKHQRTRDMYRLLDAAADKFQQSLFNSPHAAQANAYLNERGITAESIEKYRIGFAEPSGDSLARQLDASNDLWVSAGLGIVDQQGRRRDGFRGRLVFPIADSAGRVVAFGARVLPGGEGPKYRNSPEGPLYQKRQMLYGLDVAKRAIVNAGESVLCEGYTDVIWCAQIGVENAVAACGTSVTEEQLRSLRSFATRVVLALDEDTAGAKGSRRLFELEAKLGLELALLSLPNGADPASASQADPLAVPIALRSAKPVLAARVDDVFAAADLSNPEGRVRAANTALAIVADHPSQLTREQYVATIAARSGIEARKLRLPRPTRDAGPEPEMVPLDDAPAPEPPAAELEALRIVARDGDCAGWFDTLFTDADIAAAVYAVDMEGAVELAVAALGDGRPRTLLLAAAAAETAADEQEIRGRLADAAGGRAAAVLRAQMAAGELGDDAAELLSWIAVARDDVRHHGAPVDHPLVVWLMTDAPK